MRRAENLEELQAVLRKYDWTKDESSSSANKQDYFPPKVLRTVVPGTSLVRERQGGFWYWATLDFDSSDLIDVGPEKLEEYLGLRQPDVA